MSGIDCKTELIGRSISENALVVVSTKDNVIEEPKNPQEVKELFVKRIQMCTKIYDYSDNSKNSKEKLERLSALKWLREFLKNYQNVGHYVCPHFDIILRMIEKNIFRPLPTYKKSTCMLESLGADIEFNDIIIDASWPHLQEVYCLFLQFIELEGINICNYTIYINNNFLEAFILLLNSEEPKEREYVKNILYRIYSRFVPKRRKIRSIMNDYFSTMIHETQNFYGANELLLILERIICGFTIPLRKEHIVFFSKKL